MKWEGREQSSNVEDRRGMRGPAVAAGGGGLLLVVVDDRHENVRSE